MDNVISYLNANPVLWAVLGVIAILLIVAIIKKALKLIIVLVVIALIAVGYFAISGKGIPTSKDGWIEQGKELLEKGKDVSKELLEKGKEAGEDLIKKGKEEIKKKGD